MPKWYKPQLNEVGSVWLELSAEMAANYSRQGKRSWKIALLFAHGRPEDLTASSQTAFIVIDTFHEEPPGPAPPIARCSTPRPTA